MSIPIPADWQNLTMQDTNQKKIDYSSIKIALNYKRKTFGKTLGICFDSD